MMNERIRELAEQSGLKVEFWMTNPPKPFQILGGTEEFEKYTQLLIEEVLTICDKQADGYRNMRVKERDFDVKNILAEGETASRHIAQMVQNKLGN